MNFVLLATQRSGSTWVVDMLNSHPSVVAYSELLLQGGTGRPAWGGEKQRMEFFEDYRRGRPDETLEMALRSFLGRVFEPLPGVVAAGFKLMYGQAGAYPFVVDYVTEQGVAVVHLFRRNVFDIVLSKYLAASREVFHAREGDEVPPAQVTLDVKELVPALRVETAAVGRARAKWSALGVPYIEVAYEDLAASSGRFSAILEFIGADPDVALESPLRRIRTAPYSDTIKNLDAVREALAGTEFADMAD